MARAWGWAGALSLVQLLSRPQAEAEALKVQLAAAEDEIAAMKARLDELANKG